MWSVIPNRGEMLTAKPLHRRGPPGPPNITKTFDTLRRKLREIRNPRDKLVAIDYWIGWLFEARAEIQYREVDREKH